jgi:hypothetical protein
VPCAAKHYCLYVGHFGSYKSGGIMTEQTAYACHVIYAIMMLTELNNHLTKVGGCSDSLNSSVVINFQMSKFA